MQLQENLRRLIQYYISKLEYGTAEYWAEKAYQLSHDEEDLYWYACTLTSNKDFYRCYSILSTEIQHTDNQKFLAALNLYHCKNYEKALDMLSYIPEINIGPQDLLDTSNIKSGAILQKMPKDNRSSTHLLKGKIFEAIDNLSSSKKHLILSFYYDPTNFESLKLLLKYQLLSDLEAQKIINKAISSMPKDDTTSFQRSLALIYQDYIEQSFSNRNLKFETDKLAEDDNLKVSKLFDFSFKFKQAEKLFYRCFFQESLELVEKLSQRDPYNDRLLLLKISTLYHTDNLKDLFMLAHSLINFYQSNQMSWYAVACYYLLLNKFEVARFYINKALAIDKYFGPAWLLLGHSYSIISEHDQAMATYYQALKFIKGCHLVHMYIGLEYSYVNNHTLALNFLLESSKMAPQDPVVLHELGITAYNSSLFSVAYDYLQGCLKLLEQSGPITLTTYWEPLYSNLGHIAKKLRRYDEALLYFRKALSLKPKSVPTYASMGLVYALKFETSKAIELFTQGLAMKKDDAVCGIMLNVLIQNLGNEEFETIL